jgi:hypothetical protein
MNKIRVLVREYDDAKDKLSKLIGGYAKYLTT